MQLQLSWINFKGSNLVVILLFIKNLCKIGYQIQKLIVNKLMH